MNKEQETKTLDKLDDFRHAYKSSEQTFETFIRRIRESSISMEELAYWYWALEKENESNKTNLSKLEIRVKSLEKGCACFKQAQLAKR